MQARTLVVCIAAVALACETEFVDQPPSLSGVWDWTAERPFSPGGVCADTGSFRFVPDGTGWAGLVQFAGACEDSLGVQQYAYEGTDSIGLATITDSLVTFVWMVRVNGNVFCYDTASSVELRHGAMAGSSTCGSGRATWQAVLGEPVTDLSVNPVTLLMATSAEGYLTPRMRVASGQRVYLRDVEWSTGAPSVVAINSDGLVTALAAGTAVVTASVEERSSSAQVTVVAPTGFTFVSAGNSYTCALGDGGIAHCWGMGRPAPQPVDAPVLFVAIAAGYQPVESGACALTAGGSPWCWRLFEPPAQVTGGPAFASLTAGGQHACGLTAAGAAWCWGENANGQLGNGSTAASTQPVQVSGGLAFSALSAGARHTCGILTSGTLYCWGENSSGQIGDGTTVVRLAPVPVNGGGTWMQVSAGALHTCAVAAGGAASCWGAAGRGSLGVGDAGDRPAPASVAGGLVFASISAGFNHSCGLDIAGAAWCWGVNDFGQLGTGVVTAPTHSPVAVTGGMIFVAITTGVYEYSDETFNAGTAAHTCAVTTAGVTYCWGENLLGAVGHGQTSYQSVPAPTRVAGQP